MSERATCWHDALLLEQMLDRVREDRRACRAPARPVNRQLPTHQQFQAVPQGGKIWRRHDDPAARSESLPEAARGPARRVLDAQDALLKRFRTVREVAVTAQPRLCNAVTAVLLRLSVTVALWLIG